MNADELERLVRQRRSVRRFRVGADVNDDNLDRILAAGCWAPTGSNQQELRFAVVRDPALRAEFARYKKECATAPVIVLIYIDFAGYYAARGPRMKHTPHKRRLPDIDTGLCLMNMMLMAEALGLNTLPLNVSRWLYHDPAPCGGWRDRIRLGLATRLHRPLFGVRYIDDFTRRLGLDPAAQAVAAALAIGHGEYVPAAATARHGGNPVQRRPLGECVIYRDRPAPGGAP